MQRKVLIVDDNRDMVEVLQLILEMKGYVVVCLDNGEALVDAVEQIRPNLVLMDIMLGSLDGRDLCNNLKVNLATKEIPVIFISASHEAFALEGKSFGAEAFIPKPFEIADLVGNVERLIA
jgi:DNA-binding response OmpR family regulator